MRVYEYVKRLNNEIDWLYYSNFVVRFSAIKKEVSIPRTQFTICFVYNFQ